MITKFELDSHGFLVKALPGSQNILWIDAASPTKEEHAQLENEMGAKLPQHHEMHQIEYSSRFYLEENNLYLSAAVITKVAPMPESHIISFILTPSKLLTMRFSDPNPIQGFIEQLDLHPRLPTDHIDVFFFLIDALVGRVADIFELFEEKTELMALGLKSAMKQNIRKKNAAILNETLHEIIDLENVLSKCYQSLSSLKLLVGFYQQVHEKLFQKNIVARLETQKQDIKSMMEHGDFLTQKLEFQLESTLGLIDIEQTHIIKTFTVLAMIFMPPTLVASIYGMNFRHMPEVGWSFGYPIALLVMILSGLSPYLFFKKKGWL